MKSCGPGANGCNVRRKAVPRKMVKRARIELWIEAALPICYGLRGTGKYGAPWPAAACGPLEKAPCYLLCFKGNILARSMRARAWHVPLVSCVYVA